MPSRAPLGQLEFQILDTGPGIAEDQRQEIFREFHQLTPAPSNLHSDNARPISSGRDQGVGLGLAIVERIASMLGHLIRVRSQPGRGAVEPDKSRRR